MNGLRVTSVLAVFITISGCVSVEERRCNVPYAKDQGYQDAKLGSLTKPGLELGRVCVGHEKFPFQLYTTEYNRGWSERKREVCNSGFAREVGRQDGSLLQFEQPSKAMLSICDNEKTLLAAYKSSFIGAACTPTQFDSLGVNDAKAWRHKDVQLALSGCPSARHNRLQSSYSKGHDRQLTTVQCRTSYVYEMAKEDVRHGYAMELGMRRIRLCPRNKSQLLELYAQRYSEEKSRLVKEEEEQKRREQERRHQEELKRAYEMNRTKRTYLNYRGNEFMASCYVDSTGNYGVVVLENPHERWISFSTTLSIDFFDTQGGHISRRKSYEMVSLTDREDKESFEVFAPYGAATCNVSL